MKSYNEFYIMITIKSFSFSLVSVLLASQIILSQPLQLDKTLVDDNTKFTNVGNIGITLTNFGTYGHGFQKWPSQPGAEYPLGSGIEHIYEGGLWIGARKSDNLSGSNRVGPYVTTGVVDARLISTYGGGYEFTNASESRVVERSSLLSSKFYDPAAISHQDLLAEFTDTNTVDSRGELIEEHTPLGVTVRMEAYAWNFSFANYFVILNYTIKNVSKKYLDSMFVAQWVDGVVRNTNIVSPRSSGFYTRGSNGWVDSLKIGYEFDYDGESGLSNSYLGVMVLGSDKPFNSANYVSWQFGDNQSPLYFAPATDPARYAKMQGYFAGSTPGDPRYGAGVNPGDLLTPSNRSMLVSFGPFPTIAPGDSVNAVFAIVMAKKFGNNPASLNTEEQRKNLYSNADWALRAYYGEDRNRNGVLDGTEDTDGDGKITRYVLPSPPRNPSVRVEVGSQKVDIYWNTLSETSVDPISGLKDFEGYRLYRTNPGDDLDLGSSLSENFVKLAEFDSLGNQYGFNTGFDYVKLPAPVTFTGDTTNYHYKFSIDNLLNGWQYSFNVTAFDKGDPVNQIASLESSPLAGYKQVLPGTAATSDASVEVGVYPNPYYANAYWDGSLERQRKIYFYNLPKEAEIVIYTLSGDVVKKIEHSGSNSGTSIRWFQTYSSQSAPQFAGGEHAWDLISDNDQAIATGLYLFTVEDKSNGEIKKGKFLVIK